MSKILIKIVKKNSKNFVFFPRNEEYFAPTKTVEDEEDEDSELQVQILKKTFFFVTNFDKHSSLFENME
jgi:hypothetical protein